MATCIPPNSELILDLNERKVFHALDNALADEWYVIHGIKGTEDRGNRTLQWEADVTVFHPDHGIIIIEVKGGRVELKDGVWTQNSKKMDPISQCRDAAGALVRRLGVVLGRQALMPRSIGVCFPAYDVLVQPSDAFCDELLPRNLLAPAAATQLLAWINSKVANDKLNARLTIDEARKALVALNPSVSSRVIPGQLVEESLLRLEALTGEVLTATEEQVEVLKATFGTDLLCIMGGAGTGKTLLGASAARRASAEGKRTLFLTAKGRLHEQLTRTLAGDLVKVMTVADFIQEICLLGNITVPRQPNTPSKARAYSTSLEEGVALAKFVEDPPGRALSLIDFDLVVLDEAQSRETAFLDNLALLMSINNAKLIFLADPAQRVEPGIWTLPKGFNVIPLSMNCRNADLICFLLQLITGRKQLSASVQSLLVHIVTLESEGKNLTDDVIEAAIEEVSRLRQMGLSQITIVTHGWDQKKLRDGMRNFPHIPVESITDFRGCESDAVVAVLPRSSLFPLYVALSRARLALSVVARPHSFEEVNSIDLAQAAAYRIDNGEVSSEVMSLVATFFS